MTLTPEREPISGARRVARIAVAAGLVAALSAAGPIPMAFSADAGQTPATADPGVKSAHDKLGSDDADLLADSPCRRIPLPRVETEEMRFLSPDEIGDLSAAIAPRYRSLVLFDAYCGLRLSELAGLGLLAREVDPGPPVAVRYALTGSGAALAPTLGALTEWAGTHLPADRCSED